MKRRKFIGLIGLGALLIGLLTWFMSPVLKKGRARLYQPDVLSNIWDRSRILAIGKKYRLISGENNAQKLEDQLGFKTAGNVEEHFQSMIRSDFENNRTVMIDGWLISITEARQCALLSLVED